MSGCQGNTSACTGEDVMPVKLGLRRVLLLMCAGCRSTSVALSAIVERRVVAQPVVSDRRAPRRPAWLVRGGLSRDETGSVVA